MRTEVGRIVWLGKFGRGVVPVACVEMPGGSGFQVTVFRPFGLDRAGVDNKIPRRD